ncbi:MAG: Hsp20/alpha crystallin family protein [Gemmataceae bacterium]|nr:Hsp20/alpha crystallin family protein [Gemmataceae bacterium]
MAEPPAPMTKEAGAITPPEATRGSTYYTPRVDIYETADEVVLLCDLPGVKPADLDVRFEKGELTLYGKVRPRQAPPEFLQEEYGVGDFYRSFAIAPEIDPDKITAEYRDGVLTVHLPKQEKVKPKRIAVQAR